MEKYLTEDYVSFKTAKLLKEKGFECVTLHYYYDKDGDLLFSNWRVDVGKNEFAAPTLQMATKWLREDYNMHIEVRYFPMPDIYRYVIIHSPATFENIDSHPQYFNTYEEACEAGIRYCLENLI